jgi:hypothetical protein
VTDSAPLADYPPREFPSPPLPSADTHDLRYLVAEMIHQEDLDWLEAHPAFADTARKTIANWVPPPVAVHQGLGRLVRDLAMFMAASWALQLDAELDGITRTSLERIMKDWGVASSGRIGAILTYLQFVRLIEPAPGDGTRLKRYRPTPALRQLFHERFHRELTACLPVMPRVAKVLARWDEPGVFEGFMIANGRIMLASQQRLDPAVPSLSAFTHRKSGLTILAQAVLAADDGGDFPPPGPVRLNISDLSRVSAASRGQVQSVVRGGISAGFLRQDAEGLTHFTGDVLHQLSALVRMYWITMAWSGDQALIWADARADAERQASARGHD